MEKWTTDSIKSQMGKTALVTGGSEGSGIEVARELARIGMRVIICAEDVTKGETALMNLRSSVQGASVSYEHLDLADLNSVKEFSEKFLIEHDQLHLLINNAEAVRPISRITSAQGYELMFAKNYLAHFALTAYLFPLLVATHDSRIIFQSSLEHENGMIDFFDLQGATFYDRQKAYAQSKLAILIFARELDRRLRLSEVNVKSIPVHAGGFHTPFLSKFLNFTLGTATSQILAATLFAATSSEAKSGHYYGSEGVSEMWGHHVELHTAEKLWETSEELSGVAFPIRNMSNVLPFQMRGNIRPESFT